MKYFFYLVCYLFCLLIYVNEGYAITNTQTVTLQLNQADLPGAIQQLAKFLNTNVIISPAVSGQATLSFQQASADQALLSLLTASGLARWKIGPIWYIAPQNELIKRQEEGLKWHALAEQQAALLLRVWHLHYAKAETVAHVLQNEHGSLLSNRGYLSVDARTNALCISDTADRLKIIAKMINALDVSVKQIAIAARLVSIDSAYESALGLQFATTNTATLNAVTVAGQYSLAIATLADSNLLDMKLSALETKGHAKLISSPSLFTANQQPASIESGEEVPYQQVSESGGTAITFKKAVLSLKVTPQVLPDNQVLLQLQINQDRPSTNLVLGMPTITTRQMLTNVLMKNAQTIVLGGIYETDQEDTTEQVPFISTIPVLGKLFSQQTRQLTKRELLIFVTPYVMK